MYNDGSAGNTCDGRGGGVRKMARILK